MDARFFHIRGIIMKLKLLIKLMFALMVIDFILYFTRIITLNVLYSTLGVWFVVFVFMSMLNLVNYVKNIYHKRKYNKRRPNGSSYRQANDVFPMIYYYKTIKTFISSASNTASGEMGSVYMSPMDGRVHGGIAYLNANILNGRQAMRQSHTARDYNTRKNTFVPGYDKIQGEYVEDNVGRHSLWHRTHVLPFTFVLSEGDNIDGLMFTGTAHLNHGDRPQLGYNVYNNRERVNMLFDMWHGPKGGKNRLELTSLSRIRVQGAPNGTHYSMDDIEQLASRIIKYVGDKQTPFKYSVRCLYGDESVIPRAVEIWLYNLSTNQLVLHVRLPNAM